MSIKQPLRELLSAVLWSIVVVSITNWLCFQLCQVPTGSMIPTILPGDIVIVSKMHYGSRTPQTPLHIPLTGEKIPGTNLPSYLRWIQLPVYRLPGFTKIKRGDCVVFSPPRAAGFEQLPQDIRTSYIKLCIGLPGDRISMADTKELVNSKELGVYADLQHCYQIKTDRRLPDTFFAKNNITDYQRIKEGGAYIFTTNAIAQGLKQIPAIDEVKPIIKKIGAPTQADFAKILGGNEDQLPEITVPAKGMKITINKKTLTCYAELIRHYEGHKKVKIDKGKLWIDGIQANDYTFQQDYYFMLGNNRHRSADSRFWGFVPSTHIIGKGLWILASGKDPNKHFLFNLLSLNMRWNRFLKRI